jgi:tetratricopeptide (TPR) repeat protein
MPADRLETLKAMLAQDPSNSFARYGLAMEYVHSGKLEAAVDEFRTLIAANPDYPAAYYHSGRTLEKLGRTDEARNIMEQGIEVTTRLGDMHTRSELQAALDLLGV